jgi:hypothetical protein
MAVRYRNVGNKSVHRLVAEKALGRTLPSKAQVHHVDGNKLNNHPSNLVVCEDQAYHRLLHTRADALVATGNPEWRKCNYCKQWDSPEVMGHRGTANYHFTCHSKYNCRYSNKYGKKAAA